MGRGLLFQFLLFSMTYNKLVVFVSNFCVQSWWTTMVYDRDLWWITLNLAFQADLPWIRGSKTDHKRPKSKKIQGKAEQFLQES